MKRLAHRTPQSISISPIFRVRNISPTQRQRHPSRYASFLHPSSSPAIEAGWLARNGKKGKSTPLLETARQSPNSQRIAAEEGLFVDGRKKIDALNDIRLHGQVRTGNLNSSSDKSDKLEKERLKEALIEDRIRELASWETPSKSLSDGFLEKYEKYSKTDPKPTGDELVEFIRLARKRDSYPEDSREIAKLLTQWVKYGHELKEPHQRMKYLDLVKQHIKRGPKHSNDKWPQRKDRAISLVFNIFTVAIMAYILTMPLDNGREQNRFSVEDAEDMKRASVDLMNKAVDELFPSTQKRTFNQRYSLLNLEDDDVFEKAELKRRLNAAIDKVSPYEVSRLKTPSSPKHEEIHSPISRSESAPSLDMNAMSGEEGPKVNAARAVIHAHDLTSSLSRTSAHDTDASKEGTTRGTTHIKEDSFPPSVHPVGEGEHNTDTKNQQANIFTKLFWDD